MIEYNYYLDSNTIYSTDDPDKMEHRMISSNDMNTVIESEYEFNSLYLYLDEPDIDKARQMFSNYYLEMSKLPLTAEENC